mgnify:CR=1 FL=1|tara:strand:+ start:3154 stop:3927 length:774 start_codon:yes stop_codon:yes gene_type:complete
MELNINCDLGEKSEVFDAINDYELLKIINTANIACGYHAGSKEIIRETIIYAKKFGVSIGAHPGFNDKLHFGRKRINLTLKELDKLISEQLEIFSEIADSENYDFTHVKPHGALNNMACENLDISIQIAQSISSFNKDLIFIVLPCTQMITAAKKIGLRYACEIFADRNYDESGLLIDRNKKNSMISDPKIAVNNIFQMLQNKGIKTIGGNFLKTDIDTICVHGDGKNAVGIAQMIKNSLKDRHIDLKPLNMLSKFN